MEKSNTVTKIFIAGIVCSALIFSNQVLDPTLTPRIISFSFFSALVLFLLFRNKTKLTFETDIVNSSYCFFTALCVLSIAWANTKTETVFESSKIILAFTAFSLTFYCLKNDLVFFKAAFLKLSIPVCFIVFGFAFYQYTKIKVLNKEALYTITAINGHKNLFASFFFLNLFFLVLAVVEFKGLWRLLSFAAIAVTLISLVFIKTKAVWIGLTLTALIFGVLFITKKIKFKINFYLSMGICVLLANVFFAVIVPAGIEKAMMHNSTITNTSTAEEKAKELDNERLTLWLKSYDMIKKHPFVGVGIGNWQIYFPDATLKGIWRAEDLNFTFQRPHNDWLWILSETGWIGLNIFFIFIFSLLLLLIRSVRIPSSTLKEKSEMMLCVAFIVGYFTISFFDFPKERMEHLIWSNIILAVGYFHIKRHSDLRVFKKADLSPVNIVLGLGIILLITCIGVLRYRGEYYTIKMYNQRAMKQELPAIHSGYEAVSFAYSIDPTSVPVYWYTANSYANLKDYKRAQGDFLLAYKINPYNRNVLSDLGSSYAYTNNTAEAKKLYEEALRISPRFDDPKLNLAAIYIQEKNWGKADTCLKTMFKDSERRNQYQKMVDAFLPK